MTSTDEIEKHARVEAAAAVNGADPAFVRTFYRNVPAADVLSRDPPALSAAAGSLWAFIADRPHGKTLVRILPPAFEDEGSVIQIVTDDMPFLVASVTNALTDLGLDIHLFIHPVIEAPDGAKISTMHIELESKVAPERCDAVAGRLLSVLADVRSAVQAWPALQQHAEQMAAETQARPGPCDPTEVEEAAALLRSLPDENFVFLGYREYEIRPDGARIVPGTGKGLLESDDVLVFDGLRALTQASPTVQAALYAPTPLLVAKSSRRSTVYRSAPMDGIVLKVFGDDGKITGLKLLLGVFTVTFHNRPSHEIPLLRHKVQQCLQRSGFAPDSHDGQALRRILDSFPHDDLFQVDDQQLFDTAMAVLHLRQRPRIRLLVLRDPFGRFATCLVYMPRDRYNAEIRRRATAILEQGLGGRLMTDSTTFDEARLACLRVVLATAAGEAQEPDLAGVERQLAKSARSWADRLGEALGKAHGRHAAALLTRFGGAFPSAYTARHTAEEAVQDIALIEQVEAGAPLAVSLTGSGKALRLKTVRAGAPIALSDILPMLENLGVRVISEIPDQVTPGDAAPVWIHDFSLEREAGEDDSHPLFEEALREVWSEVVEDDGFNRLVLSAGLSARQAVVLRAYCKVQRQAGSGFSQAYMEDTLGAHPAMTRWLIEMFEARFDPVRRDGAEAAQAMADQIVAGLEKVENLDEDRILRAYLLLIQNTLRTNYYQRDAAGAPKPYLSVKLSSRDIDLLPLPRPLYEIYVYSPRMEGCHLRGGKVARGGIRWSDRKEDFRTEILGLMKAQMVKNAVIVPVGSKGGFVVKRPPSGGGRDALMAEVVACYKYLMCGLLDITDNLRGETVLPPPDVVRCDPDDPYLVVAADKGTATFSDIANGVSIDYGFWLGDAFASGGSVGYDHKAMGITAKGAWEAVKRHFREIGTNIQTTDFTCVGVGDMSGDVFGNGMLLSPHIKLVAAFNHMHIFIDPDPDPAASLAERKRLFDLPRSSWTDYNATKLSKGGAIYPRQAKSITLSPEAMRALGIETEHLSPQALIQTLLRLPVDLLWFGGIGTYVKASTESQADAGDRANDSLRVDAPSVRAKVIGEGANLAVTQRARIEYALRGGRLNTDAIDNSAGVDTSDHEVNIKIGVGDLIAASLVPEAERAAFLASMTGEVEILVLRDNYLQTQAISLAEARAPELLGAHVRLMRSMERTGRLNRAVEFLPDDEAIAHRAADKRGLTRPELAVLLAYAKNALYDELLHSDLPDQDELRPELLAYFPHAMRERGPHVLATHRLRREIIATCLANASINRMGPSFVEETKARTGQDAGAIARAYLIVREVFELDAIWHAIEALDNQAPAPAQTRLLLAVAEVVDQAVRWFLLSRLPLAIAARVREFKPGVQTLAAHVWDLIPDTERQRNEQRRATTIEAGAPPELADRVVLLGALSTAMDIVQVSDETGRDILDVARLYFGAGVALGVLTVRRQARSLPATTEWQRLVVDALIDESYTQQRAAVRQMVADGVIGQRDGFDDWVARKAGPGSMLQNVLADIARAPTPDLAMLTVASQRIRALVS